MAIKAGNIIVGNTAVEIDDVTVNSRPTTIADLENGTVVHNGKPKKFNKNMSAYMIDMLTSEE